MLGACRLILIVIYIIISSSYSVWWDTVSQETPIVSCGYHDDEETIDGSLDRGNSDDRDRTCQVSLPLLDRRSRWIYLSEEITRIIRLRNP